MSVLVFLDTETTGLSSNDEVIELSILDCYGNTLFNSLIKPLNKMADDNVAVGIHGITNEMLETAPSFLTIYEEVKNVLSGKTAIIYNAKFDHDMINQTCYLNKLPKIDFKSKCLMIAYSNYRCEFRNAFDGDDAIKWFKLDSALRYHHIFRKGEAHRALSDTVAVYDLYSLLKHDLRI